MRKSSPPSHQLRTWGRWLQEILLYLGWLLHFIVVVGELVRWLVDGLGWVGLGWLLVQVAGTYLSGGIFGCPTPGFWAVLR